MHDTCVTEVLPSHTLQKAADSPQMCCMWSTLSTYSGIWLCVYVWGVGLALNPKLKSFVFCVVELAMMKSYALASTGQDGKQVANRFVAYMVPKEVPHEPAQPSNRYHCTSFFCNMMANVEVAQCLLWSQDELGVTGVYEPLVWPMPTHFFASKLELCAV